MFKRIIILFVFTSMVLLGCTDRSAQSGGASAADFSLQDMSGKTVKLSDYRGRAVILEFWATWCPPCRASVPGLEKIYETYNNKGLVVLAVSMDDGGWDAVQSFIKDYGIKYTVLKGDDDVAEKYQVRSIPMLLVLNKEGRIVRRYMGFGNDEDLEKDVRAAL